MPLVFIAVGFVVLAVLFCLFMFLVRRHQRRCKRIYTLTVNSTWGFKPHNTVLINGEAHEIVDVPSLTTMTVRRR